MGLLEHKRDPATEQTAAGYPELKAMGTTFYLQRMKKKF